MKTTTDFLNALSEKLGDASDYRVAQVLGVTKQTVSQWRVGKGGMGEETAIKVAEVLGQDPKFVLSCVLAEKSKSKKAKVVLKQIADSFKAASIAAFLFLPVITASIHSNNTKVHESNFAKFVYYGKL